MSFPALQAWCLLIVFLSAILLSIAIGGYIFARISRRPRRRLKPGQRCRVFLVAAGFGMLQFFREFWTPGAAHLLVQKADEEADEDDNGDPESLDKQLHRQLRKIRRGQHVERLVLRL